jgi:hypothetical protein
VSERDDKFCIERRVIQKQAEHDKKSADQRLCVQGASTVEEFAVQTVDSESEDEIDVSTSGVKLKSKEHLPRHNDTVSNDDPIELFQWANQSSNEGSSAEQNLTFCSAINTKNDGRDNAGIVNARTIGRIDDIGGLAMDTSGNIDNDQESISSDISVQHEEIPYCRNCHRRSVEIIDAGLETEAIRSMYKVTVTDVSLTCGAFRRKFSTMRRCDYGDRDYVVPLCSECTHYLTDDSDERYTSVFPAFMWKLLSNNNLLTKHGCRLWTIVPKRWRFWWIDAVASITELETVTVDDPKSVVQDVTVECNLIDGCVKRNKLGELKNVINRLFYPTIKCPWGCTEYHIHCGKVPFDLLLYRILGNDVLCFNDTKKLSHLRGIRNDFLDEHDWQETFAWNPDWPVMPSVAFASDSGNALWSPTCLTCRKHDGGTTKMYFHPPRAILPTLPSPRGDQIAPAVVVPRVLKPVQAKMYSNTYQMQSMRGHYGGVDSMSLTTHGIFDHVSPITWSNENAAIVGRKDVNALVRRWTQPNLFVPTTLAKNKLVNAKEMYGNLEQHSRKWTAATYVTFTDAIRVQAKLRTEHGSVLKVPDSSTDGNEDSRVVEYTDVRYKPIWPKWLTFIHPSDGYGAAFSAIPNTSSKQDYRLLWFLSRIHVTVPDLWESCAKAVQRLDRYEGWILLYLVQTCFPERRVRQNRHNPFSYPSITKKRKEDKEAFVMGMLLGDDTVRFGNTRDDVTMNSNLKLLTTLVHRRYVCLRVTVQIIITIV